MPDMSNIYLINNIINQLYEDCLKGFNIKNEGNHEKKRTNITSNQNKRPTKIKLKKSILEGFTNGFFRK